jgi:hypothetical protein
MNGCRETLSIWFRIKAIFKFDNKLYHFRRFINLDISNKYFWFDSFGVYINRYLICKIFGHKDVKWLSNGDCDNQRPMYFCFKCLKEVNPGIDKIKI